LCSKYKKQKNANQAIFGLIFTVTNYLMGIILEMFTITLVTGAAGAIMILLIWIYMITQLVIYGAAFANTYSENLGSKSKMLKKTEIKSI
jgi:uncharacterized BrkB/YihY/UPF0761 family membrane protein